MINGKYIFFMFPLHTRDHVLHCICFLKYLVTVGAYLFFLILFMNHGHLTADAFFI